jgi:hypothetical protein
LLTLSHCVIVEQRVNALFFTFIGALVLVVSQAVRTSASMTLNKNKRFIFCKLVAHAEISSTTIVDVPAPC